MEESHVETPTHVEYTVDFDGAGGAETSEVIVQLVSEAEAEEVGGLGVVDASHVPIATIALPAVTTEDAAESVVNHQIQLDNRQTTTTMAIVVEEAEPEAETTDTVAVVETPPPPASSPPLAALPAPDPTPTPNDPEVLLRAFDRHDDFVGHLIHTLFHASASHDVLNDTFVTCQDGFPVPVPALVLAAVSPVYRAAATGVTAFATETSLILPDLHSEDLKTFLRLLGQHGPNGSKLMTQQDQDSITRVMDVLCTEFKGSEDPVDSLSHVMNILCTGFKGSKDSADSLFIREQDLKQLQDDLMDVQQHGGGIVGVAGDWSSALKSVSADLGPSARDSNKENEAGETPQQQKPPTKSKRGRKRKNPDAAAGGDDASAKKEPAGKPYVKIEVVEKPRAETNYGLRKKIVRRCFADEINDPKALEKELIESDEEGTSAADARLSLLEEEEADDSADEFDPDAIDDDLDEGEDEEEGDEEDELDTDDEDLDDDDVDVEVGNDSEDELNGQEGDGEELPSTTTVLVDEEGHPIDKAPQPAQRRRVVSKPSASRRPHKNACHLCKFKGRSPNALKRHLQKVHSVKRRRGRPNKLDDDGDGADQKKVCPKCGKLRKGGSSFATHVKKCGQGPGKVRCTGGCDMEFKRQEDMQAHVLIHYDRITCPIHNIVFKQEKEVYQHVKVSSPGEKHPRLQCCMCPSHFRHMCMFMKHVRRHLGIKPYRCGACGAQFIGYASLQLHQQRRHMLVSQAALDAATAAAAAADGEDGDAAVLTLPLTLQQRQFQCEFCSKSFNTKGHLKEHILGIHASSEGVNCPVCHKTFKTSKRMRKHLFNSHKEQSDKFRLQNKVESFTDTNVQQSTQLLLQPEPELQPQPQQFDIVIPLQLQTQDGEETFIMD